jgi:F-type H+-transporting ATPase subunit delta
MIPYVLTASEDEEQLAQATPDVKSLQIARVYAEALLNAAEQAGQVDEVLGEFEELVEAARSHRSSLRNFFASGIIGRRTREAVIRTAFEGRTHPLLLNLLLLVNDHDRSPLLPVILFEAKNLRDQRANRLPVFIHTAVPVDAAQVEPILQIVRSRLGAEPILTTEVDPDLLGGLKLRIGDHVFDGTVRTQLTNLKNHLISRSSHEIQSRRDRFSSRDGD